LDPKSTIYSYCNYQERCHKEVKNKLYDLGCNTTQVNELIADLITDDLLNEERYARSFARGKFRIKQWGRNKIVQHLRLNQVSDYCIKKGLSEIGQEEYFSVLKRQAEKKWHELRATKSITIRRLKVQRYLLQKGFEYGLINGALTEINTASDDEVR
jgi:regulatory protein